MAQGRCRLTDTTRSIAVANAPVSFGAFERTVGVMTGVPDGETVLDEVASAGYAGIDLGPPGYLGTTEELRSRLSARGLELCGGFIELPFVDAVEMKSGLGALDRLLDVFDAASSPAGVKAKPTLSDIGSDLRRAHPGRAVHDRSLGFTHDEWLRFADGVASAVALCRERGYEPTFHHHAGTHIEAPWEIEKLLELTAIGLCLDTGHLLLGGGDPANAIHQWRARINHLHLKDARRSVVAQIVAEAAPVSEIWRRKAFCALGEGDLDVDAVLVAVRDFYSGWIVVEQDVFPEAGRQAAADQRANRKYLAARGL